MASFPARRSRGFLFFGAFQQRRKERRRRGYAWARALSPETLERRSMMAVDSFDATMSSSTDTYAWSMSDSGTATESYYFATESPSTSDYTVMSYSDPSSESPVDCEPPMDPSSSSSLSEVNYWETPEYLAMMAAMSAEAEAEAQRQAEEQARQQTEMQAQIEQYFRDLAAQEAAQAHSSQSAYTSAYSASGVSSSNPSSGSSGSSSPDSSYERSSGDTSSSSNSTGTSSPSDPSPPPADTSGSSSGSSDSAGGSSSSATEDATAAAGPTTAFAATLDEPGTSVESQQVENGNPGGDPLKPTEDKSRFSPPELQAAAFDRQSVEGEQAADTATASDVIELPAEPSAVEEAERLAAQEAFLAKELESRRIAQERRNEAAKQREAIEKAKSQYDMNHWQLPHWRRERCDIYVQGFINDNQGLMARLPDQQSVRFERKVADPNSQVTGHAVLGFKLADGEWIFIDDNSWGGVFGKDDVPAGWMCRALGINCEPPPPRPRPDKDPADVLLETLGPPR